MSMSESSDRATRLVSVDGSNIRRNQGSNCSTRKSKKKFRRNKKKDIFNYTAKIQGATLELKSFYIATYKEAPGKAEITRENFKEVLERYTMKSYSCL